MSFYIFTLETGEYIGMRGIEPTESDLIGVPATEANIAKMSVYVAPKLIDGEITEAATPEQLEALKPQMLLRVYDKYESLYDSSLARALNKSGQGLTRAHLNSLRESYELKRNVAAGYLAGNATNETLVDLIEFECDVDFAEPRLANEVAFLNANFVANIPTENVTRMQQYCHLILAKYAIGENVWSQLKTLCETFRSKLITDIETNAFNRFHARFALIESISNETTIAEILAMQQTFNEMPN